MPKLKSLLPLISAVLFPTLLFAPPLQLQPVPAFGSHGDGSLRPGDRPYLTSDGNGYQRGMAYNPLTGHLLVVNRSPSGSETINILNTTNGADIGTLDKSSLVLNDAVSYYITPTQIP